MDVTKKQKALLKKLKNQMHEIAVDLEQKIREGFEEKKRAFALALAKIERKHAAHLTKNLAKKPRKKAARKKK